MSLQLAVILMDLNLSISKSAHKLWSCCYFALYLVVKQRNQGLDVVGRWNIKCFFVNLLSWVETLPSEKLVRSCRFCQWGKNESRMKDRFMWVLSMMSWCQLVTIFVIYQLFLWSFVELYGTVPNLSNPCMHSQLLIHWPSVTTHFLHNKPFQTVTILL